MAGSGCEVVGVTAHSSGSLRLVCIGVLEHALRLLDLLGDGEVAVTGTGHAEVQGIDAARSLGLTPTGVGTSINICPVCARFLANLSR